ncbi:Peroxidase superfamily protein [Prunus dulcis]|uniref:Peroxidase n=1 Tax=Prunus dulcis TaxID=3755 RepID=A0A4Y1RBG2_PRUDU|nr:Peroxidase superfamily protein [Prunus dulcis]
MLLNPSSCDPEHDYHKEETHESWEGATTLTFPSLSDDLPFGEFLSSGFYRKSCPDLEGIINRKVKEWLKQDFSLAASLMRLHFHDCAIRVEKKCPKTVSCADILTAATRDATVQAGGPYWAVPYGRRDGKVSIAKETEMVPMGHENITALVEFFQSQGLNVLDLVVLFRGTPIGRSSCGSVQHRLYNFSGTGKPDPSLDPQYLNYLERKCRWASDYVDLDAATPHKLTLDITPICRRRWDFCPQNQLLYSDPRTSPLIKAFAYQPSVFYHQFGVSMAKFRNVQVLTEKNEGEIRTNCNFVNSY